MSGRLCFQQTSAFLLGAGKISPSALGFQWRFFIGNNSQAKCIFLWQRQLLSYTRGYSTTRTFGPVILPWSKTRSMVLGKYTLTGIYMWWGFLAEAKPRKYSKMTTLLIYVKENIIRQKYCVCFRLWLGCMFRLEKLALFRFFIRFFLS